MFGMCMHESSGTVTAVRRVKAGCGRLQLLCWPGKVGELVWIDRALLHCVLQGESGHKVVVLK